MKRINILLVIGGIFCFSLGYMASYTIRTAPVGYNPRLIYENDSLKREIVSKDSLINEVSTERDYFDEMSDELSMKESEISYWGQKYDSLNAVNNWP